MTSVGAGRRTAGCEFRFDPSGLVDFTARGVVAARRGRGQIHVVHGRAEAVVPIEATWADVVVVDERPQVAGAVRPRLRLHAGFTGSGDIEAASNSLVLTFD